jgi:hypothetical protein
MQPICLKHHGLKLLPKSVECQTTLCVTSHGVRGTSYCAATPNQTHKNKGFLGDRNLVPGMWRVLGAFHCSDFIPRDTKPNCVLGMHPICPTLLFFGRSREHYQWKTTHCIATCQAEMCLLLCVSRAVILQIYRSLCPCLFHAALVRKN